MHVGTEKVQTGRSRLRKFVVTENQTVTVPVSHEEVRLEREPIIDGDTVSDTTITEAEHEVALTEERLVVNKETVPVEKVRLGTETVTEQREVRRGAEGTDRVRHRRARAGLPGPQHHRRSGRSAARMSPGPRNGPGAPPEKGSRHGNG